VTSPTLPDNSAWNCSGSAHGSNCTAQCILGYSAQGSTSWVSTCSARSWSKPDAHGTDNKLVCNPNCEACLLFQQRHGVLLHKLRHPLWCAYACFFNKDMAFLFCTS
jgi:hypothetical protein